VDRFSLDTIISHSTLWNGPEWITKYVNWKRMMKSQGLDQGEVVYCHMPHFQPPDPARYDVMERTYRATWNSMAFPHIFSAASLILCTTPIEVEQMVQLGCPREKCQLYLSGVDEAVFKTSRIEGPSLRRSYGIPEDTPLVTYLGTIEERKNPLAVVKVAKALSGQERVHFVIAGFPSNQHRLIKAEAAGLKNLSYIGELRDEEKIALIRESYVNILLSHMEALGLTQIEFMYGGVPIITSATGGQAWLVRHNTDGLHVKGANDITGAARAIKSLLGDPEKRNLLGENARVRAQGFTLKKMTESLCERLLDLKKSSHSRDTV
jgi:glycosyltransferase involved in cell wall biosynthesis